MALGFIALFSIFLYSCSRDYKNPSLDNVCHVYLNKIAVYISEEKNSSNFAFTF